MLIQCTVTGHLTGAHEVHIKCLVNECTFKSQLINKYAHGREEVEQGGTSTSVGGTRRNEHCSALLAQNEAERNEAERGACSAERENDKQAHGDKANKQVS